MKGFVYILKDENGRFYVGSTDNLERRLKAHHMGYSKTTKKMKNPQLVLFQEFESLKMARGVERKMKFLKRKDYIEKMITDGYIKLLP